MIKTPFITSFKCTQELGLQPSIESRFEKYTRQKKTNSCKNPLSHKIMDNKRYIKALELKKKYEKNLELQNKKKEEEKKERYMNKQKKLRRIIMNMDNEKDDEMLLTKVFESDSQLDKMYKKKVKKVKKKPIWAQNDEQVDESIDELLDFCQNLDFEKYIEDTDVRVAVDLLKERITKINIEKEKNTLIDDDEIDESIDNNVNYDIKRAKKMKRKKNIAIKIVKHDKKWNNSSKVNNNTEEKKKNLNENEKKIMKALRPKTRSIHSNKSLQNVIKNSLTKTIKKITSEEKKVHHKKYDDDINVSNLPYLYRCPSI